MRVDVAVVGGGPAGLAAAIGAARRGLSVVVLERREGPADKACGEGLMPSGVRALERLGALALLDAAECAPFVGIRYVQEDGSRADGRFPAALGPGLGVRRLALSDALRRRARDLGVALHEGVTVRGVERAADGVTVALREPGALAGGPVRARVAVAADGLASPLRRAAGLEAPSPGARRFGLRQHFRGDPWSPFVEVHFSRGVEAYVTPAGRQRVGVAFLWPDGHVAQPVSFAALLDRFPRLRERLAGMPPDSEPRGAGPLLRSARARTADRLALVGDAAGYVDAITGEGLSLAFQGAEALAAALPQALARGATRESLRAYERECARSFRRYALFTRGVLLLSARPPLRRAAVRLLGHTPALFGAVLGWVAKDHPPPAAEVAPAAFGLRDAPPSL